MALSLIVGPPNSGRAGELRRALTATLAAEPVLVVPTADDVVRFERELCEGPGALLGASVRTADWLFADVAEAVGADSPPLLTAAQRRRAIGLAARSSGSGWLAARPGRLDALVEAIDDLQAGRVGPNGVEDASAGEVDGKRLRALAATYRAYLELCGRLERGDRHTLAEAAIAGLRRAPEAWGARPVFLYGFADLTAQQLALVEALAAATTVLATVTYEEDREPLAGHAKLYSQLREIATAPERTLEANPEHTSSRTLFALERGFLADDPERQPPDGGLALLETAGERLEAESVAAEIAALLASGVAADEIAVAIRQVARLGPLYDEVLARAGVPAAVHAEVPLVRTAVGTALLALLDAALGERDARSLLTYLRAPGRAHPDQVDWLERAVRRGRLRSAEEALEHWSGRELGELAELREAGGGTALCAAVAGVARRMGSVGRYRQAPLLSGPEAVESRAARAAAAAAEELGEIEALAPDAAELAAALAAVEVPLWEGPTDGRVQVVHPYRLRAGRFSHVFVASLQEGEFPGAERPGGLLSDDERAAVGLAERADPEAEERYLFYVCLSRPTERLHLSWRVADEDGAAQRPSPFLDEVRELLDPPPPRVPGEPDPLLVELTRVRGPGAVVCEPAEASTADELARSLAALGPGADFAAALRDLAIEGTRANELQARLALARERHHPLPSGLRHESVLALIGEKPPFGASTLESYTVCSYRWFVDHELRPEPLDPRPEPLGLGSVLHATLERLYRDPPGGEPLPRRETVGAWRARAGEVLSEVAEEAGLGPHDAARRASFARMEALLGAFLAREARREWPLRPRPDLLEATFGTDTEVGPLELGGFEMRGSIDRVDVGEREDGSLVGVVRDYKLGAGVPRPAELDDEGRLQLQLYMVALRELWGIEPIGGLYEPLGAAGAERPRGPLLADERDHLLPSSSLVSTDFLEGEELTALLDRARERAGTAVAGMRGGKVARNPLGGVCPSYCQFHPICRRERSGGEEDDAGSEPAGNGDGR